MPTLVSRPHPTGWVRSSLAALAASLVVVCAIPAGGAHASGASPRSTRTAGCRAVGGSPVDGGGPNRATVIVDTGTGPVWSACVAFSGTISGIDAIELAAAQIPDLAPVYDVYSGQGRAVCRLRGVGNSPPDCLGQSVAYWAYFHDGDYARAGAGATRVADGDVEGWRWGSSSSGPRRATNGYETMAAAAPAATTTTTAPRSGDISTSAGSGSGSPGNSAGGGGLSVTPGSPVGTTAPAGRAGSPPAGPTTTTAVSGSTTSVPAGTSKGAAGSGGTGSDTSKESTDSGSGGGERGSGSGAGASKAAGSGREQAGAPAPLPTIPAPSQTAADSGAGSALGFALALAVVVGVGVALRIRRRRAGTGGSDAPALVADR